MRTPLFISPVILSRLDRCPDLCLDLPAAVHLMSRVLGWKRCEKMRLAICPRFGRRESPRLAMHKSVLCLCTDTCVCVFFCVFFTFIFIYL